MKPTDAGNAAGASSASLLIVPEIRHIKQSNAECEEYGVLIEYFLGETVLDLLRRTLLRQGREDPRSPNAYREHLEIRIPMPSFVEPSELTSGKEEPHGTSLLSEPGPGGPAAAGR